MRVRAVLVHQCTFLNDVLLFVCDWQFAPSGMDVIKQINLEQLGINRDLILQPFVVSPNFYFFQSAGLAVNPAGYFLSSVGLSGITRKNWSFDGD